MEIGASGEGEEEVGAEGSIQTVGRKEGKSGPAYLGMFDRATEDEVPSTGRVLVEKRGEEER